MTIRLHATLERGRKMSTQKRVIAMDIMSRITSPFSSLISSRSKPAAQRETARKKDRVTKSKPSEKEQRAQLNPYRAISFDFDETCCAAMKAIGNTRFLVAKDKSLLLPLSGCDAAQCSCRYVHHEDRRTDDGERRFIGSLRTDLYDHGVENNRRAKARGRRETDV
jgi:hypothetical protein